MLESQGKERVSQLRRHVAITFPILAATATTPIFPQFSFSNTRNSWYVRIYEFIPYHRPLQNGEYHSQREIGRDDWTVTDLVPTYNIRVELQGCDNVFRTPLLPDPVLKHGEVFEAAEAHQATMDEDYAFLLTQPGNVPLAERGVGC
jgi:hypothetical protein